MTSAAEAVGALSHLSVVKLLPAETLELEFGPDGWHGSDGCYIRVFMVDAAVQAVFYQTIAAMDQINAQPRLGCLQNGDFA